MGRRPKYEDITDKWLHDPKWKDQEPFMIGDYLCYEVVKGKTYEHFMYDTKGKSYNTMICECVPKDVIDFYFKWFYKEEI